MELVGYLSVAELLVPVPGRSTRGQSEREKETLLSYTADHTWM
jgi:hypothetical protein